MPASDTRKKLSQLNCYFNCCFNREQNVLSNFNFTIIEEICNASDNKSSALLERSAMDRATLHSAAPRA